MHRVNKHFFLLCEKEGNKSKKEGEKNFFPPREREREVHGQRQRGRETKRRKKKYRWRREVYGSAEMSEGQGKDSILASN